jgi:hypothetical protein
VFFVEKAIRIWEWRNNLVMYLVSLPQYVNRAHVVLVGGGGKGGFQSGGVIGGGRVLWRLLCSI